MADLNELGESLVKATFAEISAPVMSMLGDLDAANAPKSARLVVLRASLMAVRALETFLEHKLREVANG